MIDAPFATDGASLCVTDPFCPNCAKNIAEAGIKRVEKYYSQPLMFDRYRALYEKNFQWQA